MLQLTRLLYAKDEVEISLLFALLKKKTVQECIFWTYELIVSGFDLKSIIWSIYYDFYAQYNPGLEAVISRQFKKLEKGEVLSIFALIKTIRLRKCSDNVFSLRMCKIADTFKIHKGRLPKWLIPFEKEYRPFARAVAEDDWNKVMFHLRSNNKQPFDMLKVFINTLLTNNQIYAKNDYNEEILQKIWQTNLSLSINESQRALSIMISLLTKDELINTNKFLISLNNDEQDYLSSLSLNTPLDHFGRKREYDALSFKRHFAIDEHVSVFELKRFKYNDLKNEIIQNWAYHCSETPYWINIFQHFGITISKSKEVVFDIDASQQNQELFEEEYAFVYELDEPTQAEAMKLGWGNLQTELDIVDVMDIIFDENEELRFEFEGLLIDNTKHMYSYRKDCFNLSKLKKIIEMI